jgi:hypothetical protein
MGASYRSFAVSGAVALGLSPALLLRASCHRFAAGYNRCGTLDAGVLTREYFVHVPPFYDRKTARLLVLVTEHLAVPADNDHPQEQILE